jgi:hypothetical protein
MSGKVRTGCVAFGILGHGHAVGRRGRQNQNAGLRRADIRSRARLTCHSVAFASENQIGPPSRGMPTASSVIFVTRRYSSLLRAEAGNRYAPGLEQRLPRLHHPLRASLTCRRESFCSRPVRDVTLFDRACCPCMPMEPFALATIKVFWRCKVTCPQWTTSCAHSPSPPGGASSSSSLPARSRSASSLAVWMPRCRQLCSTSVCFNVAAWSGPSRRAVCAYVTCAPAH